MPNLNGDPFKRSKREPSHKAKSTNRIRLRNPVSGRVIDLEDSKESFIEEIKRWRNDLLNRIFLLMTGSFGNRDMFAIGVLDRCISCMDASVALSRAGLFIEVSVFTRMIVEACARLWAGPLAKDQEEYFRALMEDDKPAKQKLSTPEYGFNDLSDTYAIKKLDEMYPHLHSIYKECCADVHMDGKFLPKAVKDVKSRDGETLFTIGIPKSTTFEEGGKSILARLMYVVEVCDLVLSSYVDMREKQKSPSASDSPSP